MDLESHAKVSQNFQLWYSQGSASGGEEDEVTGLHHDDVTFQDTTKALKEAWNVVEHDKKDRIMLLRQLQDFTHNQLVKRSDKNKRSSSSQVISLFPQIDKRKKSTNYCKLF